MTATTPNYDGMSTGELVKAFNALSPDKPVKRFADKASALRRVKALVSGGAAKKANGSAKHASAEKTKKSGGLVEQFEARPGTVRQKLLSAFDSHLGKQLTVNALLKSVYGSANIENKGALMMSLKGAAGTIKKNKLPYQIKKEKNDAKELTIGLHPSR